MNAQTENFVHELMELEACQLGIDWVIENEISSPQEAWNKCHKVDWMVWLLDKFSEIIYYESQIDDYLASCKKHANVPIDTYRYFYSDIAERINLVNWKCIDVVTKAKGYRSGFKEHVWQLEEFRRMIPTIVWNENHGI